MNFSLCPAHTADVGPRWTTEVDSRHGLHSYRVLELDVAGYSSKHLSDRFEVHFHKWSIGYYRTGRIWPSIDGQWCAEGIIIMVMMTMAMTMIAGGSCNGSHQRSTLKQQLPLTLKG